MNDGLPPCFLLLVYSFRPLAAIIFRESAAKTIPALFHFCPRKRTPLQMSGSRMTAPNIKSSENTSWSMGLNSYFLLASIDFTIARIFLNVYFLEAQTGKVFLPVRTFRGVLDTETGLKYTLK